MRQGPGTHAAKGLCQEKAYVTGLQVGLGGSCASASPTTLQCTTDYCSVKCAVRLCEVMRRFRMRKTPTPVHEPDCAVTVNDLTVLAFSSGQMRRNLLCFRDATVAGMDLQQLPTYKRAVMWHTVHRRAARTQQTREPPSRRLLPVQAQPAPTAFLLSPSADDTSNA